MSIFLALAGSLMLTLLTELGFALLWGVGRRDLTLVALANVLTNPVVVLCYMAAASFIPGLLIPAVAVLELGAVAVEGWLFHTRSDIRFPWAFSLCANLFSFSIGLIF